MNRLYKILLPLCAVLVIAFTGCNKNSAGEAGLASETKSPGEKSFRSYCRSCHALPKPSRKTDEQWPEIVKRYGSRAKLSVEQIEQITGYLIANN